MTLRKSFVFQQEDSRRLRWLQTIMRGATAPWVVIVAIKTLWDVVTHLASGGRIVHRSHDGIETEYNPFIRRSS